MFTTKQRPLETTSLIPPSMHSEGGCTQGEVFIGSESDPYSLSFYIQIRDLNMDMDPDVQRRLNF